MIYTHVLNRCGPGCEEPIDRFVGSAEAYTPFRMALTRIQFSGKLHQKKEIEIPVTTRREYPMNLKSFLLFAPAVLLAIQAGSAELKYKSERLGLIYEYPQNFVVGHSTETPSEELVEESLIERRVAAGQDLNALRRYSLQIVLRRHRGTEAEFDRKFLMKDQFRQQIGAWQVYVFPGAPGPYGDQAFYYLIDLKDQSILEITAARSDWPDKPTHYDRVIRKLIETLEAVK
ncbi:MAG TPA: hypothetical protein VLX28_13665 [Thermoanaerobaculia bacterium]|nr:hypothetical protein [Thermoanaerobaculia bacterium]